MNLEKLLEAYGSLLVLAPFSLAMLVLLADALKALNGTDDLESDLVHSVALIAFLFLSTVYYYINVIVGVVSFNALLISYAIFLIYLAKTDLSWYVSVKDEIIVRTGLFNVYYDMSISSKAIKIILKLYESLILAFLSWIFKGDDKLHVAIRYFFLLFPLIAFLAASYPLLCPIVLFLTGYSVKGPLFLLATLIGTALTLKSFLAQGVIIVNYHNLVSINQSVLDQIFTKILFATIATPLALYSLRDKVVSWGPGAAVFVFPMLSLFFIEKGQDPLCSIAYALGAVIAVTLNKKESMERLFDNLINRMAMVGEKIIRLDLPTLPYLVFLALILCFFKKYRFNYNADIDEWEMQLRHCLKQDVPYIGR